MIDLITTTAADLMSADPVGVSPEASLREAAEIMSRNRIHCLLVDREDPRRGVGIITGKDIVQLLGEGDPSVLEEISVHDVMSRPAVTVPLEMCVLDCVNLMLMTGVRTVFVLDGSEPAGLLSFTDVLEFVVGG
ncbi:MAG: cyclic nucleotide-binding/CBS domain-containing protein [Acidimicrobiales bacterium]